MENLALIVLAFVFGFLGFRFLANNLGYIVMSKDRFHDRQDQHRHEVQVYFEQKFYKEMMPIREYEIILKEKIKSLEKQIDKVSRFDETEALRLRTIVKQMSNLIQPLEAKLLDPSLKADLEKIRKDLADSIA